RQPQMLVAKRRPASDIVLDEIVKHDVVLHGCSTSTGQIYRLKLHSRRKLPRDKCVNFQSRRQAADSLGGGNNITTLLFFDLGAEQSQTLAIKSAVGVSDQDDAVKRVHLDEKLQ